MHDEAYDRLESLGEALAFAGIPNVSDEEYWSGVLRDPFHASIVAVLDDIPFTRSVI